MFFLFNKKRFTGLIPQKDDSRDYEYKNISGTVIKDVVDLRPLFKRADNQKSWNSCAAHAVADLLDYSLKYKKNFASWEMNNSEAYLWYYARKRLKAEKQNSGTILRDYFKVIKEYGFVSENSWSYDDNVYEEPDYKAKIIGELHKKYLYQLKGYYAFKSGSALLQSKLKNALSNGYPVVFGMPVDEAYMKLKGSDSYVNKITGRTSMHAQILVGYFTMDGVLYYIVRNYWGNNWGDCGYAYIKDSVLQEKGFDYWTLM